ncbi:MAG: hypothetical protein JW954_04825 [Dehalococcoidaceae bacterium]|nr:hypothetical protein [Dehalococcoidaceae bacterium]
MKIKLGKLEFDLKKSLGLIPNMALLTGIAMGVLAAIAQGFFNVQPPVGDGVCAVSHPANLVNWMSNTVFGTEFTIHGIFVGIPVLTPIGFILGSTIAALKNKELRFRRGPVRDNIFAFILGFIIINFGLLWGSCPIRTAILSSYGMVFAMIILASIVVGVIVSCEYIKWKVRRM